jgi:SAM-dependent methyltransferase
MAQLLGWGAVWLLGWLGLLPAGLWPLAFLQGCAAALAASLMRSARWWLPIHCVFTPLILAASSLDWPPWVWLAAFAALVLVYWSSFRTQVPLFLTNRQTAAVLAGLLPSGPVSVLDLGCGIGSLLVALARLRPDARLTGIETAPVPFVLSCLRRQPSITVLRGDFFAHSWAEYALVYAFLSPVPMAAVWEKARREMKAGSLLVSNSFGIPGREPDRILEVADRRGTRLLVFEIRSD